MIEVSLISVCNKPRFFSDSEQLLVLWVLTHLLTHGPELAAGWKQRERRPSYPGSRSVRILSSSYILGEALPPSDLPATPSQLLTVSISVLSCSFVSPFDPVDCSPPGSSVHGIFQARILERVPISFSRGSSQPRGQAHISCVS